MTSSDKIKILFLISSCKVGGVPVILLNLIKGLDKERFHIELAAPNDGVFFEKFKRNIEVYDVKIRGFYPNTLFYLRKILKKRHFDIIHANGKGAGLYARLTSPGNNTKVVYSYHGFYYNHYSLLKKITYLIMEKLLLKWTDKVVCVSEGEKKQAIKARVLTKDKAVVIPNGIDIEKYNAQRSEKGGYVMGTLSAISIQKGLEYLIPAIVNLKKKYPSLLCLIGGGTRKEEVKREAKLKGMVKILGMEKTIIFLGEVDDTRSFFNKIDLYVSSSLWEGLPTAILEAFAAGVPVVATDVTGNNEVVIPDKTGILTKPKDSDSLAQAIDFAFKHKNKLQRFADNAFDFVCRGYSVKSMTNNYEALYRNLLQS